MKVQHHFKFLGLWQIHLPYQQVWKQKLGSCRICTAFPRWSSCSSGSSPRRFCQKMWSCCWGMRPWPGVKIQTPGPRWITSEKPSTSYQRGIISKYLDPLGRPTVTAGRDNCFRTCCPSVRPGSPLFKSRKTKQQKTWRNCRSGRVDHWWLLSCF